MASGVPPIASTPTVFAADNQQAIALWDEVARSAGSQEKQLETRRCR